VRIILHIVDELYQFADYSSVSIPHTMSKVTMTEEFVLIYLYSRCSRNYNAKMLDMRFITNEIACSLDLAKCPYL